jgi:hypothetical protein
MAILVISFSILFLGVFTLCLGIGNRMAYTRQLNAMSERQRKMAEAHKEGVWRGNKRLTMGMD